MSKVTIPAGYKTPLSTYEMQRAIEFIKSNFQVNLGQALNLRRVSAPLFVEENSGLNDNLNGVERPVSFDIPDVGAQGQAAGGQHTQPFLFDATANASQGVRRIGGQSLVQIVHMFIPIQLLSARNLAR